MQEMPLKGCKVLIPTIAPTILKGLKSKDDEIVQEFALLLSHLLEKFSKILVQDT
jgi:hypothetical protein